MSWAQDSVLVGLTLHAPEAWARHCEALVPEMFTGDRRQVFAAIASLQRAGKVADVHTVSRLLEPELNLSWLSGAFASLSTMPDYIRHLQVEHRERESQRIGDRLLAGMDAEEAIAELSALRLDESSAVTVSTGTALKAVWEDMATRREDTATGLLTGIAGLDRLLGGIEPGDLVLIAARPSMGKTALMLNIATHQSCPVGIFSLEMPTEKLTRRMIAAQGFEFGKFKRPAEMSDGDWRALNECSQKVPRNIHINDTGALAISALEAEAARLVKSKGAALICVDYLQLVTCPAERRLEEVSEVSRRLKALAKNLKVPVIALSQLSRGPEHKLEPKPRLADLRESGQLEQDADTVILINRPEYYDKGARPGEADLEVAKSRDGVTDTVPVAWQGNFQRFVALERRWESSQRLQLAT